MKNKKLCIRISEDDLSAVHRKAEQARMSFTEYVTRACLGKQIVVIDGLAEVIRQQKAIGKNLNQLTMLCNIGRISAVDLSPLVAESAYSEMMNTRLQYGKADGRMFYHLVQSFSPDERVTPQRAHELALKLAEREFHGFEVLVATHVDKHHIHSHFVVSSVGCESGRKLHADKDFIPKLREASDRLCMEFGLSVVNGKKNDKQAEQMSAREYRAADRGESWKMRLIVTIEEAMAAARSRGEFIRMMEAEGYGVRWTPERKYITYTTPDGQKCRDNKLHEEKSLKENMENEFGIRNEIFFGAESSCEEKHTDSGTGAALRSGNGTQLESDDRYAESAARDDGKAYGYVGSAFNEGRDHGVYAAADPGADGAYGEQLSDHRGVSDGDEAGGSGIHRLDENGTLGYVETGWEYERELLAGALSDEGYDEEVYTSISYKNKKRIERPISERLRFENTHEPLVDKQTWEIVQDIRKHKRRHAKFAEQNMFSGLVYCADCGRTMVLHRSHTMDAVNNNFMCSTYKKKGKEVCSAHYIREVELAAILLDDIRRITHFARQNEQRFAMYIGIKQGKEAMREIKALQKKAADIEASKICAGAYCSQQMQRNLCPAGHRLRKLFLHAQPQLLTLSRKD